MTAHDPYFPFVRARIAHEPDTDGVNFAQVILVAQNATIP
jgi:hypothetical protein